MTRVSSAEWIASCPMSQIHLQECGARAVDRHALGFSANHIHSSVVLRTFHDGIHPTSSPEQGMSGNEPLCKIAAGRVAQSVRLRVIEDVPLRTRPCALGRHLAHTRQSRIRLPETGTAFLRIVSQKFLLKPRVVFADLPLLHISFAPIRIDSTIKDLLLAEPTDTSALRQRQID